MSSIATTLTKFENITLQLVQTADNIGLQEAALDPNIDQIKSVKYFMGQLFDLVPHDWKTLQEGSVVGSIPLYYYTKTSTKSLTPQVPTTTDIQQIPINPQIPQGSPFSQVIGVWPIPPNPSQLHVWYSYFHPWMDEPWSACEIPDRFLEGWAAYAIARCKRIENAHSESQMYVTAFDKACEDYRIYASTRRQSDKPARYGSAIEPWRRNPSSSVVVVDPFPTAMGI
jgi:hypothetical protein